MNGKKAGARPAPHAESGGTKTYNPDEVWTALDAVLGHYVGEGADPKELANFLYSFAVQRFTLAYGPDVARYVLSEYATRLEHQIDILVPKVQ